MEVGHGQQAGRVIGPGVLGHQVATRAVVAIQRHPMPGEVKQQAVGLAYLRRQHVGEKRLHPRFGDVLDQEMHLIAMFFFEQLRQARGVVHWRSQWRDAVAVVIDADDASVAGPEFPRIPPFP